MGGVIDSDTLSIIDVPKTFFGAAICWPPIRLLPLIPGKGKEHHCWAMATRWRRRSSGAKWTDWGRLFIIIMTRLKSGLANLWVTRGMKKPGSPPCFSGTFHSPTFLAQDQIIYLWDVQRREQTIEAEKERKKQLAKEAALASCASSSLNQFGAWASERLIHWAQIWHQQWT